MHMIGTVCFTPEDVVDGRMIDWLGVIVIDQVLLADIGDVGAFVILGEKMIKGLLAGGTQRFGNRFVPFLAVGENGVDVEHNPAKAMQPVPHDIANPKPGVRDQRGTSNRLSSGRRIKGGAHEG